MARTHSQKVDDDNFAQEVISDCDNSDNENELRIDLQETPPRKRAKIDIDENEKRIIETVSKNFERIFEEKAAKTNLKACKVKNILKQVITNEHVLAHVKRCEHPEEEVETPPFEPKITRSKAKELFVTVSPIQLAVAQANTKTKSSAEVQAFIEKEFREDSSDDEYVPSEDDFYSESDPPSVSSAPPTTPTKNLDTSFSSQNSQTQLTDDGIFKIPPPLNQEKEDEQKGKEEDANIALRTRSKVCLSNTPLEVIEEAFVPPDITTDMYDLECDDDVWAEFLKDYHRPLDEVADDEGDPEYNILADESIDLVDKEELRSDKGVKISRKEMSELRAELSELMDMFYPRLHKDISQAYAAKENEIENNKYVLSQSQLDSTQKGKPEDSYILFYPGQLELLNQQLRQHVQMCTQNFLLSYEHPEFAEMATEFREYLYNFKYLAEGKIESLFHVANLDPAIKLIETWEQKFFLKEKEAEETKLHFKQAMIESSDGKKKKTSLYKFPNLILDTISNSEVFMYTNILPQTPFMSDKVTSGLQNLTKSETSLIALGLEQFIPYLAQNKENLVNSKTNKVNLTIVSNYIHKFVLGGNGDSTVKIRSHIYRCKASKHPNPIKYYFQHQRAPLTYHSVVLLEDLKMLPPCKRERSTLPYPWDEHIYPQNSHTAKPDDKSNRNKKSVGDHASTTAPKPSEINCNLDSAKISPIFPGSEKFKQIVPKEPLPPISTKKRARRRPNNSSQTKPPPSSSQAKTKQSKNNNYCCSDLEQKLAAIFKNEIALEKLVAFFVNTVYQDLREFVQAKFVSFDKAWISDMLPSMPSLLCSPVKEIIGRNVSPLPDVVDSSLAGKSSRDHGKTDFVDGADSLEKNNGLSGPVDNIDEEPCTSSRRQESKDKDKDNIDDINALMKASSTIKSAKKEPSGAEKKKIKLRREFVCNLRMVTPEKPSDIERKSEEFAKSYYNKLKQTLIPEDYKRVMEILTAVDESKIDALDVYNRVSEILLPKYEDMAEEFLLFLNDMQINSIGKLVPFYMARNMALFLQKVDLYFQDKPCHIKRIYRTLRELGEKGDGVSENDIKKAMLPLLRANSYLCDLFLRIFTKEHPPDTLTDENYEDSYETIDIVKDTARPAGEEIYESIVIPDVEDKYGNIACVCSCHENREDDESSPRKNHCIPCGTKYLQGNIYIQTSQGLRPAVVRFLVDPKKNHVTRLNGETNIQNRKAPAKNSSSPSKKTANELSAHTHKKKEDEGGGKRKARSRSLKSTTTATVKKQASKTKTENKNSSPSKSRGALSSQSCDKKADINLSSVNSSSSSSKTSKVVKSKRVQKRNSSTQNSGNSISKKDDLLEVDLCKPGPSGLKRTADELNCSMESITDIAASSAESENEFFEESSQANTISDDEASSSSSSINLEEVCDDGDEDSIKNDSSWTRDEDKVILETFQREPSKDKVFNKISKCLSNRSIYQIKNRFETLMSLIQEMTEES